MHLLVSEKNWTGIAELCPNKSSRTLKNLYTLGSVVLAILTWMFSIKLPSLHEDWRPARPALSIQLKDTYIVRNMLITISDWDGVSLVFWFFLFIANRASNTKRC